MLRCLYSRFNHRVKSEHEQRVCNSLGDGLRDSTQSGLCRTDRPYIPRLKPAREALPPVSPVHSELPGKEPESLSGGSRGRSPLAARANASGELRSEATQRTSSLDEIQNNRNTLDGRDALSFRALGRNRNCGIWTIVGNDGVKQKFHRLNCKTWSCCYCGPRKAKRYKYLIGQLAQRERLTRFLTVTLDPSKIEGDSVRYLRGVFNKFRLYLRRRYGMPVKYIAVLEFHQSGVAHLHLLVDRFIPWEWIKQSWSALGGGEVVFIKYVDVHRISRYLSKYLTKELLLSAPKRSRRVTTSRSLRLIEKKDAETGWELFKVSIFFLFSRLCSAAKDICLDVDGFLESFSYVPAAA
jgi:hypothetical protein